MIVALVALAFLLGGFGLATAGTSAIPCMGERHHAHHQGDGHKHQPCDPGQICACCVAINGLPVIPAAELASAPALEAIVFWARLSLPAGQSIIPDPAPPKAIA